MAKAKSKSIGEFEQLVLLAVLRIGEGAYTVPIVEEIEERTGRRVTNASVYVALKRLEEKGFVSSALGDPTPERGGRAKRFFTVEPTALPVLRDAREAMSRMWEGLEELA